MRTLLTLIALLAFACREATVAPPKKNPIGEDKPGEAAEYYALKRQGAADPHARYAAARQRMQTMARYSSSSDTLSRSSRPIATDATLQPWTFLGPGNIGGRTRTLIIDSDDPDVMYAGGVSGGVWKSDDAGSNWRPIGDELANLAVNSMAMDPRDHRVLYVGTGEGYFREEVRGTALPLRGHGIFVTRDSGATWHQLASTTGEDFHWVNDLAISRHDSNRIYAATRTGVWRSTDGGETWARVLATTVKGGCLDLATRGDTNGDYLFASCGTFEQATVYRSPSAQSNQPWQAVLSEPNMGRTSLAISPTHPSTIYALSAAIDTQKFLAIHRSDENGDAESWTPTVTRADPTKLNTLLLENAFTASLTECGGGTAYSVPMGWYCNVIAVDPSDRERVWVGGVDLFRSDDGGKNFGVASYWWSEGSPSMAHADHHGILFHPQTQSLFTLTDGGVYRSDNRLDQVAVGPQAVCFAVNSKVSFTSLNRNYGITQFYNGAVFPDGRRFIGGAQDNGTLLGTLEGGIDGWTRTWGGDGGYVAIHPQNPDIVYAESQFGAFVRSIDGGRTFSPITRRPQDTFLFIPPIVIDPTRPSTVWVGGSRLWRSDDDGIHWAPASDPLDGLVSAIAVRGAQVLAGTNTGALYLNGKLVSPRDGFVSWIAIDQSNPSIAYATYAGFGGTHVWRSADGGNTWSPIDNGLPDIPVHSIAVDGIRLYLGTDLGVFVSLDSGQSWAVENTGFAPVVTETVVIARGGRGPAVYAFTHGRGVWRSELASSEPRRRAVRR
jgi:photosystem II stability/assembly factor-like uncharacterized protein